MPWTVQQSTLVQMDGRLDMPVQWPAQAVLGKGGLRLAFSERLADPQQGVPGLRTWWQRYPYSCLEPPPSGGAERCGFVGRRMGRLPTYLDDDGLAVFCPAAEGRRTGSDTLQRRTCSPYFALHAPDRSALYPAAAEQARN